MTLTELLVQFDDRLKKLERDVSLIEAQLERRIQHLERVVEIPPRFTQRRCE